jgi:hypothetical protein
MHLDETALAQIARSANFVDLFGQVWQAIQGDQPSTLPLTVLADALIDQGHREAGLAIYGVVETGRHSLEIDQLSAYAMTPRPGDSLPGREIALTVFLRPPSKPDDDNVAGRFPVKKNR